MKSLKKKLKKKGYLSSSLMITSTNHIILNAFVNGIHGLFILDTGASNTCVALRCIDRFNLVLNSSEIKATGAMSSGMQTYISKKNIISIGNWESATMSLIIFDLTTVNTALIAEGLEEVAGILGADLLINAKAIIDYDEKHLYLKR